MKTEEPISIHFWQGNQACAEGALAAGCRFFAGYPITPASEIAEIMSRKLPKIGGTYLQMEDEIGAIAAVIGASWGGALSMTATSGPGFSLMQENIGYAMMTETPCVIVNVQRAGPSTGQATKAAQGDVYQSRWGTHGDHESIVLVPNSVQETFEMTLHAFDLSERFRHPVILLSDEIVAHSRERVKIEAHTNFEVERIFNTTNELPFAGMNTDGRALMSKIGEGHDLLITGSTHDLQGYRKTADPETHNTLVRRLVSKIRNAKEELLDIEINGQDEADWGIISFGSTSRSVNELMMQKRNSLAIKSLRLKTLWPFPDEAVRAFADTVSRILVPELNLGQLIYEVSRVVPDSVDVVPLNKIGGGLLIEPEEMLQAMQN